MAVTWAINVSTRTNSYSWNIVVFALQVGWKNTVGVTFLIVQGVVLHICDNTLALNPFNDWLDKRVTEKWILPSKVLK